MRRGTILVLIVLLLAACSGTSPTVPVVPAVTPPPGVTLGITGSASRFVDLVTPVLTEALPDIDVQFVIANQETLQRDLAAGLLDGILVHHLPPQTENWFNPVAMDGLVIVTHPQHPLTVTPGEIQALFSGEITNWGALNGRDAPVTPLVRETDAGARLLLAERVMGARRFVDSARVISGDAALQEAVAADETAVGFSMMGNAGDLAMAVIDGIPPTPQTAARQQYPLAVPLYFVNSTPDEPQDALRVVLAWLQSPAGQEVIGERYGRVR